MPSDSIKSKGRSDTSGSSSGPTVSCSTPTSSSAPEPISFTVPGRAATKGSMRVVRGNRLIQSNKREGPWAHTVSIYAIEAMRKRKMIEGPVMVILRVMFSSPAKPSTAWPVSRRHGDVDKLARSMLDALTGIVYNDDAQVIDLRCTKSLGPEDLVEITVEEVA